MGTVIQSRAPAGKALAAIPFHLLSRALRTIVSKQVNLGGKSSSAGMLAYIDFFVTSHHDSFEECKNQLDHVVGILYSPAYAAHLSELELIPPPSGHADEGDQFTFDFTAPEKDESQGNTADNSPPFSLCYVNCVRNQTQCQSLADAMSARTTIIRRNQSCYVLSNMAQHPSFQELVLQCLGHKHHGCSTLQDPPPSPQDKTRTMLQATQLSPNTTLPAIQTYGEFKCYQAFFKQIHKDDAFHGVMRSVLMDWLAKKHLGI